MTSISVGQALLILLDKYQGQIEEKLLKELYIEGASDLCYLTCIDLFLSDPILTNYTVSKSPQIINEDPTRRYFETHLCIESLHERIGQLDLKTLMFHHINLDHYMEKYFKEEEKLYVASLVNGQQDKNEYSDFMTKMDNGDYFPAYSEEDKSKLKMIMSCSVLGITICNVAEPQMPINVYDNHDSFYSSSKRGRITKSDTIACSNNLGTLKSYMPVPVTDAAYYPPGFHYTRVADTTTYDITKAWPKKNFALLVHPFSTSISGTLLAQLRVIKFIMNMGSSSFLTAELLRDYLRCFIAILLFHSGGHTLFEFCEPLQIDRVKTRFSHFKDFDQLSLTNIFYHTNLKAFNRALEKVIIYNKAILRKRNVHVEITKFDSQRLRHTHTKILAPDQMQLSFFKNKTLNASPSDIPIAFLDARVDETAEKKEPLYKLAAN